MDAGNNLKNNFDSKIEKLIESVAKERGFSDYTIEKAPGAVKGDGYMGDITTIRISGKDQYNKKKILNLVLKSATKNDVVRREAPIANVFKREIYMYNTVIPTFRKFQIEKGLPLLSNSAKCYKACIMDRSEAVVLENLKEKGYSVWERRLPMEDDHVKLIMAELGYFHALSYALRDQNPAHFKKLIAPMDDIYDLLLSKANLKKILRDQCIKAQYSLNEKTDKEALERFLSFSEEIVSFLGKLPGCVDNHSVILHGDCWTNNMLFKYDDADNPTKPTKMCLIDLQLSRLGSPVLDLSFFFYACSSEKVINNLEYYLGVYYDSLSVQIKQLGSNPEELYPYSVFRQQWEEFARFGLICSMVLIYIMLSEQNEAIDFTEVAESGKSINEAFNYDISNIDEYHRRVRHIILHFLNNNII